jgi:hypothetical protein
MVAEHRRIGHDQHRLVLEELGRVDVAAVRRLTEALDVAAGRVGEARPWCQTRIGVVPEQPELHGLPPPAGAADQNVRSSIPGGSAVFIV